MLLNSLLLNNISTILVRATTHNSSTYQQNNIEKIRSELKMSQIISQQISHQKKMFGGNNEKDLEGELKNYGRQHSSPTVIKVATGLKKDFNTQGIGKEDSIHSSNYIQNDLDEAIYKYDIHPFSVFDKVPVQSSSSSNNNNNSASNNNSGANATTITFPPPPKDLSDPELDLFHTFFADARKKYHNKDSVFREQLELLTSGGKKKSEKEKIVARSSEQVDKEGWLVKEGRFRKNWKKRWFVLSSNTLSYYTAKKNKL